jgi:MSHA biogenesis protein MshM
LEIAQSGKRVVLCLDEAQAMPEETMESLRLLTNLETEKFKLLQVVMFGQPELNTLLDRQSVRQLKQRITYSYQLQPLEREGMDAYIMHRLVVAGYHGGMLFEAKALEKLLQASRGIPRLINILCHKALMVAYGQGQRSVTLAFTQMAIRDTEDAQLNSPRNHWWQRVVAGFALAAVLISISSYVVHATV